MRNKLIGISIMLALSGCGSSSDPEVLVCPATGCPSQPGGEDLTGKVDDAALWDKVDVEQSSVKLTTFGNDAELNAYFDKARQKVADLVAATPTTDGGANSGAAESDGASPAPTAGAGNPASPGVTGDKAADDSSGGDSAGGVSSTNLQEIGVDEADLVKNDGNYLYITQQPKAEWVAVAKPLGAPVLCVDPPVTDVKASVEPPVAADVWYGCGVEGEYQYTPGSVRVMAMTEKPASTKEVAQIALPKGLAYVSGLYLQNTDAKGDSENLAVVGSHNEDVQVQDGGAVTGKMSIRPWYPQSAVVDVHFYNVADPAKPSEAWKYSIEGSLVSSRRIDNMLYLVTSHDRYYGWWGPMVKPVAQAAASDVVEPVPTSSNELEKIDINDVIPKWSINDGTRVPVADPTSCYYDKTVDEQNFYSFPFTVITAIDLNNPTSPQSTCVATYSGVVYVSANAVYMANTYYPRIAVDPVVAKEILTKDAGAVDGGIVPNEDYYVVKPVTQVHKFAFTKTGVEYRGSGAAKGSLNWSSEPQFRMGEHDGAFGIMTTLYSGWWWGDKFEHRLTFLAEKDGALTEASHLPNDAHPDAIGKPGEQLYATRFLGDRVYAVTYRRTDPLYVIDIADVNDPKIAGALEIPGFSEYLHPVSDGLLLGVGRDAADVVADGTTASVIQGLRLALFDVADVKNPIEINHVIIGKQGSDSAALYDHHALTFLRNDTTHNHRLTIPVALHDRKIPQYDYSSPWQYYGWTHTGLYEFEIADGLGANKKGITQVGKIIAETADVSSDPWGWAWGGWTYEDRSVLQGNAVHYVHLGKVWSAQWADEKTVAGPQ